MRNFASFSAKQIRGQEGLPPARLRALLEPAAVRYREVKGPVTLAKSLTIRPQPEAHHLPLEPEWKSGAKQRVAPPSLAAPGRCRLGRGRGAPTWAVPG